MNRIKRIILILFCMVSAAMCPEKACAVVDAEKADSIVSHLSEGSASDTIRQLYDAFDLASWKRKGEIGWTILDIARRNKDYVSMSDQLLQLSTIHMADSIIIQKLLTIADELPEGDDKKAVRLFVRVEGATGEATFLKDQERLDKLMKYVKEDITIKDDIFENVYDLYCTTLFLGKEAKGGMYLEYINRLEKMIEELPEDLPYIRNLFYTSAAIFYTQNKYPAKALECDRMLLRQIEKLERKYEKMGRRYRNYDRNRYICYRRMLRNYEALSEGEVADLYSRCVELAGRDTDVWNDFNKNGRVKAYKMFADKNYAGAIPYLKQALAEDPDMAVHYELAGMLVEAADSVGDKATLLESLKEYNRLLVQKQKLKSDEALRELQIRYDVSALKKDKTQLELEKKDMELATDQKLISVALVALFVMAIVLMILCRGYFRLRTEKELLTKEKETLRKSMEEYLHDGKPSNTKDLKTDFRKDNPA